MVKGDTSGNVHKIFINNKPLPPKRPLAPFFLFK